MSEENRNLEETTIEENIVEEKEPFEPAPRWKRIAAWILAGIVTVGVINWLITIAYPQWPQYVMGLFR